MSLDSSLKSKATLARHRNVLTRAERVEKMMDNGIWQEGSTKVFGLPKLANRKSVAGKKKKKEVKTDAAAATAAPAAPAAPAAAAATTAAAAKKKK